jgi:hypothetical protein
MENKKCSKPPTSNATTEVSKYYDSSTLLLPALCNGQRRGLQPDHPGAAYSSRPCFASEIQDHCPDKY